MMLLSTKNLIITTIIILYDGNSISLVDLGLARWIDEIHYKCDIDYSYFGDLILYLLYSRFEKPVKRSNHPWYDELEIDNLAPFLISCKLILQNTPFWA